MKVPEALLYTDRHEWLAVDGEVGTVGITDYAQNALGEIVFVELPAAGRVVATGEELWAVESHKAAVGFCSPVSGTVLEVNGDLENDPALINQDPYGQGWICKIAVTDLAELSQLMRAVQYQRFCGEAD